MQTSLPSSFSGSTSSSSGILTPSSGALESDIVIWILPDTLALSMSSGLSAVPVVDTRELQDELQDESESFTFLNSWALDLAPFLMVDFRYLAFEETIDEACDKDEDWFKFLGMRDLVRCTNRFELLTIQLADISFTHSATH